MKKLPTLPFDKANHDVYGSYISAIVTVIAIPFVPLQHLKYVGIAVSTIFGVGKELIDLLFKSGDPDWLDALNTSLGGLKVSLPLMIVT